MNLKKLNSLCSSVIIMCSLFTTMTHSNNSMLIGMTTVEMIKWYKYPVEEHRVLTEDGYILRVQRIPSTKSSEGKNGEKIPILLLHGLMCSAMNFIDNGPKSLAFVLADEGFDVWLGNLRGSSYPMEHVHYTTADPEFWNFNWDHYIGFDIPATWDYILNDTQSPSILHLGYALGFTLALDTLALKPEYNQLVKGVIGMSPASITTYITNPTQILADLGYPLYLFFPTELIRFGFNLESSELLQKLMTFHVVPPIVDVFYSLIGGRNPGNRNLSLFASQALHCPAGSSFQVVEQTSMLNPPEYELSKVTTRIALVQAPNDPVATPLDIAILKTKLPQIFEDYTVAEDTIFSHLDFMWGINAHEVAYPPIIKTIHKMWEEN